MNPFNNTLDWSFRGKYVRVHGTNRVYEGWVDRIHHKRSSLVIHDATDVTGEEERDVGSVYVRVVEVVEVLSPSKTIELVPVSEIEPSPHHDQDFEVSDDDMRYAYRDQFTGGYPVVRPIRSDDGPRYELINGHKRIEACRRVGLDAHPVEIVEATDEEATELFELAHRQQTACDGRDESDDRDSDHPDAKPSKGGDDSRTDSGGDGAADGDEGSPEQGDEPSGDCDGEHTGDSERGILDYAESG